MITILMATYNGELYIKEQLDSILNQREKNWRLIIQDDCSTDSTCAIASEYAEEYPDKIKFLKRAKPSGSAKENFFSMIKYVDTDYCMTCDQDDVWLPEKISVTLYKMQRLEKALGSGKPLLIHSDLTVVDENLKTLSESMFSHLGLDSVRDKINNLLVQNIVTGCTVMVNRPLLSMISKTHQDIVMHDWWFALIASAFGGIGFVDTPTLLYRQHGANSVGAKKISPLSFFTDRTLELKKISNLQGTYLQAGAFVNCYGDALPPEYLEICRAYASIPKLGKVKGLWVLWRYGFWKKGILKKIYQVLVFLT